MKENGQIENALYYSTSCGLRMEDDASDEAVFCCRYGKQQGKSDLEKEESLVSLEYTFFALAFLNNRLPTTFYPGSDRCRLTSLNILQSVLKTEELKYYRSSGTLGQCL